MTAPQIRRPVGADSATYALTSADVGKRLKVRVTFTDDESNAEEVTSGVSNVVAPAADLSACPASPTLTEPWCATLTVGCDIDLRMVAMSTTASGFSAADSVGSLDPLQFEFDGVTYEVTALSQQPWLLALVCIFATTPNLPADAEAGLTLHLQSFGGEHDLALATVNVRERRQPLAIRRLPPRCHRRCGV